MRIHILLEISVHLLFTMCVVATVVFFVLRVLPGDPAVRIAGMEATAEEVENIRIKLGISNSLWEQYSVWIRDVFFRFHFGHSFLSGADVSSLLRARLPYTFTLTFISWIASLFISLWLALVSCTKNRVSVIVKIYEVLFHSAPRFLIALVALYVLSVQWQLVPLWSNRGTALIIPVCTLAFTNAAMLTRMLRVSLEREWKAAYVRTARSFGASQRWILFRHMLPNALMPFLSLAGIQVGYLLSGSIILEQMFSIPGLGQLLVSAILDLDYPVVQAIVFLLAMTFALSSALTRLVAMLLHPPSFS